MRASSPPSTGPPSGAWVWVWVWVCGCVGVWVCVVGGWGHPRLDGGGLGLLAVIPLYRTYTAAYTYTAYIPPIYIYNIYNIHIDIIPPIYRIYTAAYVSLIPRGLGRHQTALCLHYSVIHT